MLDLDTNSSVADASPPQTMSTQLAAQVLTLLVDSVTASVVTVFEKNGIDSILVKGPGFASLLYGPDCDRFYSDTDLLVQLSDVERAEELLRENGFVRGDYDEDWLGPAPKYAHTFHRPADGGIVDLHWSLSGATVSPQELWSVIRLHTTQIEVGGRAVHVLDASASALLVALHNAHHGTERPLTLTDLDRAVERLESTVWLDAVCLADLIGANKPFAAGLRLTEAGDALADRLGLDRPASVEMWLKTNPSTYGAYVLDRLSQTRTIRGRAKIFLQVAIPPRVVMYRFFPMSRRGPFGLGLAYLTRPLRLAAHSGPAIRDWLRARRALRTDAST